MNEFAAIVNRILTAHDDWELEILLRDFDQATVVAAVIDAIIHIKHPSSTTFILTAAARGLQADDATVTETAALIAAELPETTAAACVRALQSTRDLRDRLHAAGVSDAEFETLVELHRDWDIGRADDHDRQVPPFPRELGDEDTGPAAFVRRQWVLSELDLQRKISESKDVVDEVISGYRRLGDVEEMETFLNRYTRSDASEALVEYLHHALPEEWHHTAWLLMNFCSSNAVVTTRLLRLVEDAARPQQLRNLAFHALCLAMGRPHRLLIESGFFDNVSSEDLSEMLDAYHVEWAMVLHDSGALLCFQFGECEVDRFDRVCDQLHTIGLDVDWLPFLDNPATIHLWPRVADELVRVRDGSCVERLVECAEAVADDEARAHILRAVMRLRAL